MVTALVLVALESVVSLMVSVLLLVVARVVMLVLRTWRQDH